MDDRSLSALLRPQSIAIVGISPKGGPGMRMLRNNRARGFTGPIHPVNPNYREIEGSPCHGTLADLPAAPDCVVVAVPARAVFGVLEDVAAVGAPAALVIAEGFADAASDEGRDRQKRLHRFAERHGIAVAGPNCMGISGLCYDFANTFGNMPTETATGGVSVVSQSGGLLNAVAELGNNRNVGFNYLISSGNEAVVESADYIGYLADDPATRVIACIMEGAKDGARFRRAIERAARIKPLVVLKLGRSEIGRKATLAHTGTLAGRDEAYGALFRQNGVAQVDSIDALVETAALFARAPLPAGDRVVMFTVSGGATSLIGDLGEAAGLNFPPFSVATNAKLQEVLEVARPFANPMDTVGLPRLRKDDNLSRCVEIMLADEDIDLIGLVLGMRARGMGSHQALLDQLAALARGASKPVIAVSFIANSLTGHWRTFAQSEGLAIVEDMEGGLRAVRHLIDYAAFRRRAAAETDEPAKIGLKIAPEIAPAGRRGSLTEFESKCILAGAGLPVTREGLARDAEQAVAIASDIGYPVALKIQSPDVPHKSDAGGVALGVNTAEEVRRGFARITANLARSHPDAAIDGLLVQEMVAGGIEFILGMTYDLQFGPLVVCGIGGLLVELLDDVATRLPPLSSTDVRDMLEELRGSHLLDGVRGTSPSDRDALVEAVVSFSRFVCRTDGLFAAIDINPLIVLREGQGVRIADALIIPKTEQEATP